MKEESRGKLTDRRAVRKATLLCAATYMISYMMRINFSAVIAEVVGQTGVDKSRLSLVVTGNVAAYGAGQLLAGWMGDRVSPKRLVFAGLMISAGMNILLPFCPDYILMTVVWSVSGLAQAFIWPPLVRILSGLFYEKDYNHACTVVNWGSPVASIIIYLLAPAAIFASGWKLVFFIAAALGIAQAFFWRKFCVEPDYRDQETWAEVEKDQEERVSDAGARRGENELKEEKNRKKGEADAGKSQNEKEPEKQTGSGRRKSGRQKGMGEILPLLTGILAAIILHGALRDGVTTWMPSYILEIYHLSSSTSILTGIFLPLLGIVGMRTALWLYEKLPGGNPLSSSAVIFGVGAGAAFLVTMLAGRNMFGSVVGFALLIGSMHGVDLILISVLPPFFRSYGKISTMSGLLNSFTYAGSAIATYGTAALSERAGWQTTVFVWFLVAAAGTVICAVCAPGWRRKMQ